MVKKFLDVKLILRSYVQHQVNGQSNNTQGRYDAIGTFETLHYIDSIKAKCNYYVQL